MKKQTNEPFGTPDADGWYEWKGDDMVRPAGSVDVLTRKGQMWSGSAEEFNWNSATDIVKWRPAQ